MTNNHYDIIAFFGPRNCWYGATPFTLWRCIYTSTHTNYPSQEHQTAKGLQTTTFSCQIHFNIFHRTGISSPGVQVSSWICSVPVLKYHVGARQEDITITAECRSMATSPTKPPTVGAGCTNFRFPTHRHRPYTAHSAPDVRCLPVPLASAVSQPTIW